MAALFSYAVIPVARKGVIADLGLDAGGSWRGRWPAAEAWWCRVLALGRPPLPDPERERIQRLMLVALRSEPVAEVSRRDRAVDSRPGGCRGFPRWATGRLVGNGASFRH
jgi:hypothetical protein